MPVRNMAVIVHSSVWKQLPAAKAESLDRSYDEADVVSSKGCVSYKWFIFYLQTLYI